MNNIDFQMDTVVPGPFSTNDITRGICRYLTGAGYSPLTEFKLLSKRRVDIIGLDKAGRFAIIEVKSSVSDFKQDKKWRAYLNYGDQMYFGVASGFPIEMLPKECGVLVSDAYNAIVLREAPVRRLNAVRRKTQIVRFARTAGNRLHRQMDPKF